jgi:DNA-binding cell septation regulator SpoVG
MTAAIEVLAIRRLDGTSNVKAFCDLRLGGVTIKGAKIVQQDGQRAWVAMPSIKTDRAWQNVVELSKELRERVTEIVLEEWDRQRCEVIPPERPVRGQSTWDRSRDYGLPTGETREFRNEKRDPRQDRIDELARRFDERPPDEIPF